MGIKQTLYEILTNRIYKNNSNVKQYNNTKFIKKI